MKVFVTDGASRAALAVTRSLGRAGHEVVVGEKYAPALAQASRYCHQPIVYPDPAVAEDAFVSAIESIVVREHVDILLPVGDVCMFLLTAHRDRFGRCRIPFPSRSVVARAADKVDVTQAAMRLGVPVPRSLVVASADVMPTAGLAFPLVVKPRQSRTRAPGGWVGSTVSFANDADALRADLAARPAHDFPLLLQERIVGPGTGVFVCMRDGRPIALFSHRRLRERPPWAGVSVLCESVALDPVACDAAVRLLADIGWRDGVAMVEFKRDDRDGLPKLMEINGRFWGSLQLAIDAGVDFPRLLVQVAEGDAPPAPAPYSVGVRSRWLWGDFDSLMLTLIGRARAMGMHVSRWRALRDFLVLFGRNLYYENPRFSDLGPWWLETRERVLPRARPTPAAGQSVPRLPAAIPDADVAAVTATPAQAPASPAIAAERLHVTLASSFEELDLDAAGWNALLARNDTDSVFQTYEWLSTWCDVYREAFEPILVTVRSGGRVVGVLPLMRERSAANTSRSIRFLSDTRADYCDVIVPDRKDEVMAAALEVLLGGGECDVLELRGIPENSQTTRVLSEACADVGAFVLVRDQAPCPTLLVQGHLDSATAILHKQSLRRRVNYFKRTGRLVYRDLSLASDIDPYLDVFFAQHISRRAQTDSPSLFLDPSNVLFYRRLVQRLSDTGWNLFTVVEHDDQPIAFHYGFDYHDSLVWYKPAFDVHRAKHSPGLVLVSHLIEYAIQHNRRELDFTVGNETFKHRLTNYNRTIRTVNVYRKSVDFAVESWRRTVTQTVKQLSEIGS